MDSNADAEVAAPGTEDAIATPFQAYCGSPLLPGAPTYAAFHASAAAASPGNVAFYDTLLARQALTDADRELAAQFRKFPPFMIRRSSSKYLCDALVDGAVSANGSNTPAIEKSLYNANRCVFTSIGSPEGQPQWGDVLITFDADKAGDMWATPRSGWYYAMTYNAGGEPIRGLKDDLQGPATAQEREFFKNFIFTRDEWQTYLVDAFMLRYKALAAGEQEAIRGKLLGIDDRYAFQMAVFQYNMGYYLEAHANETISLGAASSIRIPKSVEPMLAAECPDALNRWKSLLVVGE
jgi:hypothetical protein